MLKIALGPILAPFLAKPANSRSQLFFRLLRVPRALQQALQEFSEGLRVKDAIWNQFRTGFGSDFGDPGPLKIRFSCKNYCIFCDFAIFNPDSILDPILDLLGLRFGSFLTPKMVETCLEIRLGPPKSGSRLLFSRKARGRGFLFS